MSITLVEVFAMSRDWASFSEMESLRKAVSEKEPKVMNETHCDPECPFLDTDESTDGICKRDGKEIMWYDWHIAHCVEQKPKSRYPDKWLDSETEHTITRYSESFYEAVKPIAKAMDLIMDQTEEALSRCTDIETLRALNVDMHKNLEPLRAEMTRLLNSTIPHQTIKVKDIP